MVNTPARHRRFLDAPLRQSRRAYADSMRLGKLLCPSFPRPTPPPRGQSVRHRSILRPVPQSPRDLVDFPARSPRSAESRADCARHSGVLRNLARKSSSEIENNEVSSKPCSGPISWAAPARLAFREGFVFHGQTSWQTSQPNSQLPISAHKSVSIAPRCSIVK